MSKRAIRNSMIVIIIIAIVVILLAIYLPHKQQTALPKAVTIDTTNQPTIGNPNAKLHIVAFEDLKCSNCMRFNKQVFPKLNAQYIKTGKAKYTMVTVAFIPGSVPAANAAYCIYHQNNDAFFDFVEAIYANQPPENENWATIPTLMLYASKIKGVNLDQLQSCLIHSPYNSVFINNLNLLQQIMKPPVGTPSVYINGVYVSPPTWERTQQVIKGLDQ